MEQKKLRLLSVICQCLMVPGAILKIQIFPTKSFYGNKKSGKDVVSEKFPPLDNLCGINVDNNLDINDINNDSFQDIARFNPELCSSFIEPPNDSDNGAISDLDNTVQGLFLDGVNDM